MTASTEIKRQTSLISLPNSLQIMIIQLADNYSATVKVCKSMKIVSDEAQVLQRKKSMTGICRWEENWDVFNYITKKEWGTDGRDYRCKCGECEPVDRSKETVWEMYPRHFKGREYTVTCMIARVFGERCLIGSVRIEAPLPFTIPDAGSIMVFRHRVVMIKETSPDNICVTIRDHAHDGIQPIMITRGVIENRKGVKTTMLGFGVAKTAAKIVYILGKSDFAINVIEPYSLRSGKFMFLEKLSFYDKEKFMKEMKEACDKHNVSFMPRDIVFDPLVMLAWENGPISFFSNGVLFTSDVIENWVPDHVKELL